MTKIIKKQFEDKINNLLKIYQVLKKLQRFTIKDLKENIENLWAITFGFIAAIEATLDIFQYILSEKEIKSES